MHGVFPSSRREFRIFTESSISLSQYWRQCSSHYTIHAGRNLPAKEFRYLRTVRVTAAVYQGFNFMLAHILFTLRHRAGIRPYTSCYYFAKSCVFTKQLPLPLSSHTLAEPECPPYSKVTESICRVPSILLSQSP